MINLRAGMAQNKSRYSITLIIGKIEVSRLNKTKKQRNGDITKQKGANNLNLDHP